MWNDMVKKEWEKNPLMVIFVASFAANAGSRFINAWSAAKGRRAYAKMVNYRVKK